jgi:hypothetical protein
MTVSGVLISWLIMARKADFARSAASARARPSSARRLFSASIARARSAASSSWREVASASLMALTSIAIPSQTSSPLSSRRGTALDCSQRQQPSSPWMRQRMWAGASSTSERSTLRCTSGRSSGWMRRITAHESRCAASGSTPQ